MKYFLSLLLFLLILYFAVVIIYTLKVWYRMRGSKKAGPSKKTIRQPEEIAQRLILLARLHDQLAAPGTDASGNTLHWLKEEGIWKATDPDEQKWFLHPIPENCSNTLKLQVEEALGVCLYCLGLLEKIPFFDERFSFQHSLNRVPLMGHSTFSFIQEVGVRSFDEINKQREMAEFWEWRAVQWRMIRQQKYPGEQQIESYKSVILRMNEQLNRVVPSLDSHHDVIDQMVRASSLLAFEKGKLPACMEEDFVAFNKPYRELSQEEYDVVSGITRMRHHSFRWICNLESRILPEIS